MSIAYLPSTPGRAQEQFHDSLLAEQFLIATHNANEAVIAVNGRVLMANGRASEFLDTRQHQTLWESVATQVSEITCTPVIFTVPGHSGTAARCHPVADGDLVAGVILTLDISNVPQLRLVGDAAPDDIFPGRSDHAVRIRDDVARIANDESYVLITGESGTGKTHIARHLLALNSRDGDQLAVVDARESGDSSWLDDVAETISTASGIVIKHLDELISERGIGLFEMLQDSKSKRVVATARAPIAACNLLDGIFPTRLHLPPLREHMEDIPAISAMILRRYATRRGGFRLSPDARRALWVYEWPQNVEELKVVLDRAVERSPSRVIEAFCVRLPQSPSSLRGGRVGMLKQDEKQKLLDALARANNNKLVAADLLGIARSTLYRKLDTFGIAG